MLTRRAFCAALLPAVALAQSAAPRTPPIRILVDTPAGGGADRAALLLAEQLAPRMGYAVVAENAPDAIDGLDHRFGLPRTVIDEKTLLLVDEKTLLLVDSYTSSLRHLVTGASRLDEWLAPAAGVASTVSVLAGSPATGAHTLEQLTDWLKANPDKAAMGYPGVGAIAEMIPSLIGGRHGIQIRARAQYTPGTLIADLRAGNLAAGILPAPELLYHVRSGRLQALAVTGKQRLTALPQVPTFAELGYDGSEGALAMLSPRMNRIGQELGAMAIADAPFYGLWGPREAPREFRLSVARALGEVLADPRVQQRLAGLGMQALPLGADAFEAHQQAWGQVYTGAVARLHEAYQSERNAARP